MEKMEEDLPRQGANPFIPEPNMSLNDPSMPSDDMGRAQTARRTMFFLDTYIWLLLLSTLDVVITWLVLHAGGREVNKVANLVLENFEWPGMVLYKFVLVAVFIILCEEIGRRRYETGRTVALIGLAISALPLVLVPVQLFMAYVG